MVWAGHAAHGYNAKTMNDAGSPSQTVLVQGITTDDQRETLDIWERMSRCLFGVQIKDDFCPFQIFLDNLPTVHKNLKFWGTWVAQSVKHLPLAQVMIPASPPLFILNPFA